MSGSEGFSALFAVCIAVVLIISVGLAYAASGPSGGGGGGQRIISKQNITATEQEQLVTPGSVKAAYKCSEFSSRKERIRCRIGLEAENEPGYLPEECRAMIGAARGNCTRNYALVQKCWQFPSDKRRFECARNEFALRNVASERAECEVLGDNKSACMRQLRGKVDLEVKFRIYNLEEKAEKLKSMGVSEDLVVDLVMKLEE
ncbi:hypothetical protein HY640_01275, partial [Candidatus Woesearchaeota archaeon]|nr:hypothetical protein [Candidatus Woesearchaeota archaeon]